MGIFTTKFINTFMENKVDTIINCSSNYDVGEVMCNISSLALNEYYNCATLLESTIDDKEQQLYLEAKMNVLLEFSLKDIWEKIKAAFRWIVEKFKEAGRAIKSLFTKSKVKETKNNLNKAKEEVKKQEPVAVPKEINQQIKTNADKALDQVEKETKDNLNSNSQTSSKPVPNPTNHIKDAIEKTVKEENNNAKDSADKSESPNYYIDRYNQSVKTKNEYKDKSNQAIKTLKTFYEIMYDPSLYFDLEFYFNKDYVSSLNSFFLKMLLLGI